MTPSETLPLEEHSTFHATVERFGTLLTFAESAEACSLTHAALEVEITHLGRDVLQQLIQDHFALRAKEEVRLAQVEDAQGMLHTTKATNQTRPLVTVFGPITVSRVAYRHKGSANLYPADCVANLPTEIHSHGLREIAAREAVQGSFDAAVDAIAQQTGQRLGKRQVEQLAQNAAVDVDSFYAQHPRPQAADQRALVISADGKGIVMRRDGLRRSTAKVGEAGHKLRTRLSAGEKRGRKRMAEVGSVYDVIPVVRTPTDILQKTSTDSSPPKTPGPKAQNKWLTASVVDDAGSVIKTVMEEAERRDPHHERPWVALVDGNNDQLGHLQDEARKRKIDLKLFIDFIHVLEYLWKAAWCFFAAGDPQAESWVLAQGLAILNGKSSQVAAAIRRKATTNHLTQDQRKAADRCADYLLHKRAFLDYPTALARGWPIATGIIEGACRHLVKDRFDITGARWGLAGAEAILKLRAVWSNGDWTAYWAYHLVQEQQRVHHSRYATPPNSRAA
jgi:hypothetical protein